MRRFAIAALISLGAMAAVPAARANEALDPSVAHRLDGQSAAYSMTAAKRERLMIIQENLARQRHYERRYGPRGPYGGYGYGRPYGPPPYAPAYGYRRPYYDRW
ncbi:hypothetical protein [Bosea sp. (in: a-proteobacteria)]|uniref:hypothetical protein n=1 Tax=Bosea sp. (in: a-proteobacteria) TaxID=1871050 RepID=UPI001AD00DFF|nr:hypothetical protein [Bosea sp. (in: a-proteobacteria)]MBN9444875.1 hypothetical protein [Bosea sp. (in: a-proteobacteria)]